MTMDCRHWLLGLFAVSLLFGCNRGQTNAPGAAPVPAVVGQAPQDKPDKKVARRNPTASTCVAFGNMRLDMASDPTRSAQEKETCYDEARRGFQEALKLDPKYLP